MQYYRSSEPFTGTFVQHQASILWYEGIPHNPRSLNLVRGRNYFTNFRTWPLTFAAASWIASTSWAHKRSIVCAIE